MGSNDSDRHTVTVSSFYIGKYEVTQAEYAAITGYIPSKGGDRLPMVWVTWYHAVNYCNKRSKIEGLTPCYDVINLTCNWNANGYRLPTEAEWEYTARGGKYNSPYTYSGSDNIDEVAWYKDNSYGKTHEVGTKKANALGIYDMSGNVREWCWDWYNKYYWSYYYGSSPAQNPRGPVSGSNDRRVIRGGSWDEGADDCRCAYPMSYELGLSYRDLGFRVVRSAK